VRWVLADVKVRRPVRQNTHQFLDAPQKFSLKSWNRGRLICTSSQIVTKLKAAIGRCEDVDRSSAMTPSLRIAPCYEHAILAASPSST
jgi:hypothetical protein